MIITRGYKLEDKARLHEINEACYTGVQRPAPAEFDEMLKCTLFVARHQAEYGHPQCGQHIIIGFAIVHLPLERDPYLWSLAVDPAYQGRGVAGNLLREVIKHYTLAKARAIGLHVQPSNPAQKLYFDYGFRVMRVARYWYGAEGDGLYMYRVLP